jgi:uncharacterized protein YfaT (DUF1175 family)
MMSRTLHWVASVGVAALLLAGAAGWRLLTHPGLRATPPVAFVPADGAEHLASLLRARSPLPLRSADLRITGAPASGLRLEDRPHGEVAVYLRTPVLPGRQRIVITDHSSSISLPITLTATNTDSFGDGTPDFLRLHSATDRDAFRRWFTSLAERAADAAPADLPPEITDCASLLRYAYRESLRRHDDRWYAQSAAAEMPDLPSVEQWSYPNTPLGLGLFRTRPGAYLPSDDSDGTFAQFADAKTLISSNTFWLSRDLSAARPGDLIFFRQLETDSQYHSMIVTGEHSEWVVYHTGPINKHPGEMRRVLLADLLRHPDPRWRPVPSNPNFLGVYRWNILRGP